MGSEYLRAGPGDLRLDGMILGPEQTDLNVRRRVRLTGSLPGHSIPHCAARRSPWHPCEDGLRELCLYKALRRGESTYRCEMGI
jgi:hypothetical protein